MALSLKDLKKFRSGSVKATETEPLAAGRQRRRTLRPWESFAEEPAEVPPVASEGAKKQPDGEKSSREEHATTSANAAAHSNTTRTQGCASEPARANNLATRRSDTAQETTSSKAGRSASAMLASEDATAPPEMRACLDAVPAAGDAEAGGLAEPASALSVPARRGHHHPGELSVNSPAADASRPLTGPSSPATAPRAADSNTTQTQVAEPAGVSAELAFRGSRLADGDAGSDSDTTRTQNTTLAEQAARAPSVATAQDELEQQGVEHQSPDKASSTAAVGAIDVARRQSVDSLNPEGPTVSKRPSRDTRTRLERDSNTEVAASPADSITTQTRPGHKPTITRSPVEHGSDTTRTPVEHESDTIGATSPSQASITGPVMAEGATFNGPAPSGSSPRMRASRTREAHKSNTSRTQARAESLPLEHRGAQIGPLKVNAALSLEDKADTTRTRLGHDIASDSNTLPPADSRTNRELPRSPTQRSLLRYLLEQQVAQASGRTPVLSRAQIADATGIKRGSVATTIQRLVDNQLLRRVEASTAWNCGGASYIVPRFVANRLAIELDSNTDPVADSNKLPRVHSNTQAPPLTPGSSSSKRTTTTPGDPSEAKKLHEQFRQALGRFAAGDFLTSNDLMQLWTLGIYADLDDLLESVEHVLFYVASPSGSNLGKAWVMKTLRSTSYYDAPPGFKSWRERQREELEKRVASRQAQRLADFELRWKAQVQELDGAARKAIIRAKLGANTAAEFIPAPVALAILRDHFAAAEGLFEFCSDNAPSGPAA